jgi:hypothetical protein
MAIVRLSEEEWYSRQSAKVLEALAATLPHAGRTVAEVKEYLKNSGFDSYTDAEWQEIARRLVAGGKIVIN